MERKRPTSETNRPRKITKADLEPVVGDLTDKDFVRATGMTWDQIVRNYGRNPVPSRSTVRVGGDCDHLPEPRPLTHRKHRR